MHARYCKNDHSGIVPLLNNAANVWKKMHSRKSEVEPTLKWTVGQGNIDACLDWWLDLDLSHTNASTPAYSLFLSNKEVDIDFANVTLGNSNIEIIKNSLITLTS